MYQLGNANGLNIPQQRKEQMRALSKSRITQFPPPPPFIRFIPFVQRL